MGPDAAGGEVELFVEEYPPPLPGDKWLYYNKIAEYILAKSSFYCTYGQILLSKGLTGFIDLFPDLYYQVYLVRETGMPRGCCLLLWI